MVRPVVLVVIIVLLASNVEIMFMDTSASSLSASLFLPKILSGFDKVNRHILVACGSLCS